MITYSLFAIFTFFYKNKKEFFPFFKTKYLKEQTAWDRGIFTVYCQKVFIFMWVCDFQVLSIPEPFTLSIIIWTKTILNFENGKLMTRMESKTIH